MNTCCVVKDTDSLLRKLPSLERTQHTLQLVCCLNAACQQSQEGTEWYGLLLLLPPAFTLLGQGYKAEHSQRIYLPLPETLLNVTGLFLCLDASFLQPYINTILANRNSFKRLASRWALLLFQGLMQFLLYSYIPLVILGAYKERSICLCSQCHIAQKNTILMS